MEELSDNTTTLSCSDAEENHDKNRYSYNMPCEKNNIQGTKNVYSSLDNNTRVRLNINTFDDNNYINASKVDV